VVPLVATGWALAQVVEGQVVVVVMGEMPYAPSHVAEEQQSWVSSRVMAVG
jgi:hypothetical protein